MDFNDYTIIPNMETGTKDLFLTTLEEVKICEHKLDINFEKDYVAYVTKLGRGILGGTYIRVFLPERILNELSEWWERIDEYWFWDAAKEVLTKDQVLRSIRLGDTLDGDEILFYNDEYFILSMNDEMIYKMGKTLEETIHWLCTSGILTEPFSEREFEPYE